MDATEGTDVLVVGGGQAGLAAAYYLKQAGVRCQVLERHRAVGDSWRARPDALALFTSRRFSALPGLGLPGDPEGYASKDEVADYLQRYAAHFALPLRLNTALARLTRQGDQFHAVLGDGARMVARAVIVTTGPFQVPVVPALADALPADVLQLTAASYRNARQFPGGTVLVAGDGPSGRQIALELAATHRVILATGQRRYVVPQRVLGQDLFWWTDKLGLIRARKDRWIGKTMRQRDPFPGLHLTLDQLARRGIAMRGRVASVAGRVITFASGDAAQIDGVVWATGYRDDFTWLAVDGALDAHGAALETWGVSPIPGLYYVGRSWQSSRGSAALCGVGRDAQAIVQSLVGG